MTDCYYIEQGPPCGSDLRIGVSYTHLGPYKTFSDAIKATDASGISLLHGHTALKILRDRRGEHWEVWPRLPLRCDETVE